MNTRFFGSIRFSPFRSCNLFRSLKITSVMPSFQYPFFTHNIKHLPMIRSTQVLLDGRYIRERRNSQSTRFSCTEWRERSKRKQIAVFIYSALYARSPLARNILFQQIINGSFRLREQNTAIIYQKKVTYSLNKRDGEVTVKNQFSSLFCRVNSGHLFANET